MSGRRLELVVQSLGSLRESFAGPRGTVRLQVVELLGKLPSRERFRVKRHVEAGRRLGLVEALDECERLEGRARRPGRHARSPHRAARRARRQAGGMRLPELAETLTHAEPLEEGQGVVVIVAESMPGNRTRIFWRVKNVHATAAFLRRVADTIDAEGEVVHLEPN